MKRANRFFLTFALLMPLTCVAEERCPLRRQPVASVDEALSLAKQATVAYKLSSVPIACLDFRLSKQYLGVGYEIVIREVHSKACGGDAMTSPRVADMNISPRGYVTTDVYSVETGAYRPLVCNKNKKHRTKH